jgi:beta-lactamase class D
MLTVQTRVKRWLAIAACAGSYACAPAVNAACVLYADAASGKILKQDGACEQRLPPMSTFKIAISLMGYDAGILKDEHTPVLPYKKGYVDWNDSWLKATDPTAWIKDSVVWYSQQTTIALGAARFQDYVHRFKYGNEDVSGNPGKHDGLTEAWLNTSLRISPPEQLAFLRKIVRRELGVSDQAYVMTGKLTTITTLPNGWLVHGKTGNGAPHKADGSSDRNHAFGWYVGWAEKEGRNVVFVHQMQDSVENTSKSPGFRARDLALAELPAVLDAFDREAAAPKP